MFIHLFPSKKEKLENYTQFEWPLNGCEYRTK